MDVNNILIPGGCSHYLQSLLQYLPQPQSPPQEHVQRKLKSIDRSLERMSESKSFYRCQEEEDYHRSLYPCQSFKRDGCPCPKSLSCKPCVCLECDAVLCLNSQLSVRKHRETGHSIGYGRSTLFCFQCSDLLFCEISGFGGRSEPCKTVTGLRGIINFGNTCYINSILQVLVHTPSMSDLIKVNDNHTYWNSRRLRKRQPTNIPAAQMNSPPGLQYCEQGQQNDGILAVFKTFLKQFQYFTMGLSDCPVKPTELLVSIWEVIPQFAEYKQQDAHEFFLSVINQLHVELIRFNPRKPKRKKYGVTPAESLIDQIFLGWMMSEVICTVCRKSRFSVDPFRGISLEMNMNSDVPPQLHNLLKQFTSQETLEDKNELLCPICNKNTKSTKQLSFKVLPPVICIQLKRFHHNGNTFKKLKGPVAIPEVIDFAPFTSEGIKALKDVPKLSLALNKSIENTWYNLYAIVNHAGTNSSGHYYTFVKKSAFWFKCDDENVQVSSQEDVLNSEGYLLFYTNALSPT